MTLPSIAKMDLARPVFKVDQPNPSPSLIPDAIWWSWRMKRALVGSDLELGGVYANKSGFHNTGKANTDHGAGNSATNYSIRDTINRSGPGWTKACALDSTFRSAQSRNYANIDKYTSRLVHSSLDAKDPRLDLWLFEFYGQADTDSHVEGRDEYHEKDVTSDSSHLWHIHESLIRSRVDDMWGAWANYTVWAGWTVAQWRASLPSAPPPVKPPAPKPTGLTYWRNGRRTLKDSSPDMTGTDVLFVQTWIGPKCGKADGIFGAGTEKGVRWYQSMRGIGVDGQVGPKTWAQMGIH